MDKYRELQKKAMTIRELTMKCIGARGFGHIGGSLDLAEVMSCLYFDHMRVNPKNPNWEDRDRFVLSKGHGGPAVYATLVLKGFFPEEELLTLNQPGTHLPGHCDRKLTTGIDMSTGSLGQGFSVAVGMALAAHLDKRDVNVYTIIGDGESQEGIIWEAAMAAAHYHLDNLTVFLDHNRLQIDGPNEKVMNIEDIVAKYAAFNWETFVVDGHDIEAIVNACKAPRCGKPRFICCNTIKGKGVSFMENQVAWHGKAFNEEEYKIVKADLGV